MIISLPRGYETHESCNGPQPTNHVTVSKLTEEPNAVNKNFPINVFYMIAFE